MALAIPVQDNTPRTIEGGTLIPETNIPAGTTVYFDLAIGGRGWTSGTVWAGIPATASLTTAKRLVAIIKIGMTEADAHAASDDKRYISFSVHSWTVPFMRSYPYREAARLSDVQWGWAGGQIRLESCRIYDDGQKIRLGVRNTHGSIDRTFGAYVDWIVHK